MKPAKKSSSSQSKVLKTLNTSKKKPLSKRASPLKKSLPKPKPLVPKAANLLTLDLARHCGWAFVRDSCPMHSTKPLVVECGTIDIGAHTTKRWLNLESQITGLLTRFTPELVIIEQNFIFKNVKTTAALNQLRGVILLLAAMRGIKVDFVDNNSAKKRMLGSTKYWDPIEQKYLGVSKDMMHEAVLDAMCPDCVAPAPGDNDASDAIALAFAFYEVEVTPRPLPRKPIPLKMPKLMKAA